MGWGSVSIVLPGVATAAGNPPGGGQGRGEPWRHGAGVLSRLGSAPGGVGEGFPVVLSEVAIAAGDAHFVSS